jgi:hypothetical protein
MMRAVNRISFLLVVLAVSAGCDEEEERHVSYVTTLDSLAERDEVTFASDVVQAEGKDFLLDPSVWRNMMPGCGINRNMIALVSLQTVDMSAMPAGIRPKMLYVVYGSDVWVSTPRDESHPHQDHELIRVSRDGPTWGPGVYVDVVLSFEDGVGHIHYVHYGPVEVDGPS